MPATQLFEQCVVGFFLALPVVGLFYCLAVGVQDPATFWGTVGLIGTAFALVAAHIRWVRPYFRRFYWVVDYPELWRRTRSIRTRHPQVSQAMWRKRLARSAYRIGFALLFVPIGWQLYVLHGHHFTWFMVMYLISGFGVTVGYHRSGPHRGFKMARPVRLLFLAAGATANQGMVGEWCKKHAKHHAFADTTWDPHSPFLFTGDRPETRWEVIKEQVTSLLHSTFMWAFREKSLRRPPGMTTQEWVAHLKQTMPDPATFQYRACDADYWELRKTNGPRPYTPQEFLRRKWEKLCDDLGKIEDDPEIRRLSHPVVYVLLFASGLAVPWFLGGISVWESLARIWFLTWATFSVNSVSHLWGERPFLTADNSMNNAFVEVVALGEGGHNVHHKADFWATHGIFPWQFDPSAVLIRCLAAIRLVDPASIKGPRKREVIDAAAAMERRYREAA